MAVSRSSILNLRPHEATLARQRLPYFTGISRTTAGSEGLAMHLVEVPPGAASEPHSHVGYETGIYVLSGRVETRFGERLEQRVISEPGDFVYVPPGVPHQAVNLSETETARAVVARNVADEEEQVELYTPPSDEPE